MIGVNMETKVLFFVLLLIVQILLFIYLKFWSGYSTHLNISKLISGDDIEKIITYEDFRFFMRNTEEPWYWDEDYEESIFSINHKSRIHANLIIFNNKYYIAKNAFEYYKIDLFVKQKIKESRKRNVKYTEPYFWNDDMYKVFIENKLSRKIEKENEIKTTESYISDEVPY